MANGRKINMGIWLNNTGRQFCPDCEIEMIRKEDCYWECPECGGSITDEDVETGFGYPTLEAARLASEEEDEFMDYDELYNDRPENEEFPGINYDELYEED